MDPFLFAALVFLSQATAPPAPMGGCTNEALVGMWRMTKGTFGGKAIPLGPSDPVPMKQVTPTHFVMFTYEPAKKTFLYTHGIRQGDQSVLGESVDSASRLFAMVGGSKPHFQCQLTKDTWRISGQLSDGTALDETWTRAPKPCRHARRRDQSRYEMERMRRPPHPPLERDDSERETAGGSSVEATAPLRALTT